MADKDRGSGGDRDRDCIDGSCELLVSPVPRVRPRPLAVTGAPRRRRVLFVDSGKPNSDRILALARSALTGQGVEVGPPLRKRRASRLADEELLRQAAGDDGLVLLAVND